MAFKEIIDRLLGRTQAAMDAAAKANADRAKAAEDRRRLDRIELADREALRVSFILDESGRPMESAAIGKSGQGCRRAQATVVNLSHRGLGACFADLRQVPGFERDLNCGFYLELDGEPVESRCRIAWVAGKSVGIQFLGLSPEARQIVNHFLSPRFLGQSMHEITAAQLKVDQPELRLRWFQGKDNTNLLSWETLERDVVRQRFLFTDYVVDWERGKPLKTGEMGEESPGPSFQRFARLAEDAVVFYDLPSAEIICLGEAILKASRVDASVLKPLLDSLGEAEHRMGPRRKLGPDESAGFRFLTDEGGEIPCRVEDIGIGGLRAALPADKGVFPYWKHSKAKGRLELGGRTFEVPLVRVADLTEKSVHLEFVKIPKEATEALRELLG